MGKFESIFYVKNKNENEENSRKKMGSILGKIYKTIFFGCKNIFFLKTCYFCPNKRGESFEFCGPKWTPRLLI